MEQSDNFLFVISPDAVNSPFPEKPLPVLLTQIKQRISNLGPIHHSKPSH